MKAYSPGSGASPNNTIKAGAYGIQDPEPIVRCVWGDPTNVIGLPMARTKGLLAEAGI